MRASLLARVESKPADPCDSEKVNGETAGVGTGAERALIHRRGSCPLDFTHTKFGLHPRDSRYTLDFTLASNSQNLISFRIACVGKVQVAGDSFIVSSAAYGNSSSAD